MGEIFVLSFTGKRTFIIINFLQNVDVVYSLLCAFFTQGFGPSVRSLEGIDVESIPSLQEQPVTSSITIPASSGVFLYL